MFPTLPQLSEALAGGRTTSRQLVEECLSRIEDPAGEGARSFISVDAKQARATADACDVLRAAGAPLGPFAGIPVSIKDLFDIEGQVTRAGSRVLDDAALAVADAPTVARLRTAGFILIGRTNMTEFAYSGLGLNPHYGTPRSVWDRQNGRVPGGSSSGAAISVADGMAHAALGTDTGGSCRIPAAFNGLTGVHDDFIAEQAVHMAMRFRQLFDVRLELDLSLQPVARATRLGDFMLASAAFMLADKTPMRRCTECGHWTEASHAATRYCSNACRLAASRRKKGA